MYEIMIELQQGIKSEAYEIVAVTIVIRTQSRLPHDTIMDQKTASITASAIGGVVRVVAAKGRVNEIKDNIGGQKTSSAKPEPSFASCDAHERLSGDGAKRQFDTKSAISVSGSS